MEKQNTIPSTEQLLKLFHNPNEKETCCHCGAGNGLHHYETSQCPKNGVEEWREGKKQEWEAAIFKSNFDDKIEVLAPLLAQEVIELRESNAVLREALQLIRKTSDNLHDHHDFQFIWEIAEIALNNTKP